MNHLLRVLLDRLGKLVVGTLWCYVSRVLHFPKRNGNVKEMDTKKGLCRLYMLKTEN